MVNKEAKQYYSVSEVAKLLGISRVAVFKKIKAGKFPAEKVGRSYAISADVVADLLPSDRPDALSEARQLEIDRVVGRVIREYGETLRLLGEE